MTISCMQVGFLPLYVMSPYGGTISEISTQIIIWVSMRNFYICHGLPNGRAGARLRRVPGRRPYRQGPVSQLPCKVTSWDSQEVAGRLSSSFPPNSVGTPPGVAHSDVTPPPRDFPPYQEYKKPQHPGSSSVFGLTPI